VQKLKKIAMANRLASLANRLVDVSTCKNLIFHGLIDKPYVLID